MRLATFLVAALGLVTPAAATPSQISNADLETLWSKARSFADFVDSAEQQRARWRGNYERGTPADADIELARQLMGGVRLLAVAEDWCSDSVDTVPYLARLVEAVPEAQLRIIDSSQGDAVLKTHTTADGRKATPTIVLLDASGAEIGAFIERPAALQAWYFNHRDELTRQQIIDRKTAWYDEDRGRSTVRQLLDLLPAPGVAAVRLTRRTSGTDSLLQAISAASASVVWASGHDGTWARSLDGGVTWSRGVVGGAEHLQFRDVHAIDADRAYLMSAGPGDASRIYRTDDGGVTWRLQFHNDVAAAFLDSFAFWDESHGLAFSDSVDGEHFMLRTGDGETWQRVAPAGLPPALPGEGCFAASGTCVVTGEAGVAWVGTGAGPEARVLSTRDGGDTWTATVTPLAAGGSSGIASLAFADASHGAALGGDMSAPDDVGAGVAITADGGASWSRGASPPFAGAVYGAAFVPGSRTLIAVGPGGMARSDDGGASWRLLDDRSHWAVGFATATRGWAVGPGGRITEISVAAASQTVAPQTMAPQAASAPLPLLSADDLLRLLQGDEPPVVVDVRTAEEFAEGHVPGAINIPHTEIGERAEELRALGDVEIVLYCRSGRRTGLAGEVLRDLGFQRLLHLDGDMLRWQQERRPVQKQPQA